MRLAVSPGLISSSDVVVVGRVGKPHGVMGAVKVKPETDDPARLVDLLEVWIGEEPEDATRFEVRTAKLRPFKQGTTVIFEFVDIHSRAAIEALVGLDVFVRAEQLPPLQPGEMFLHDFIDAPAKTLAGEAIGTVVDVVELPASRMFVIETPEGREVMVPDVPDLVPRVDTNPPCVWVDPIEGLLDLRDADDAR
jgi:16S rRNA processing protein RimM